MEKQTSAKQLVTDAKKILTDMAGALAALSEKHAWRLNKELEQTREAGLFAREGRLNAAIGSLRVSDDELAKVPGVKMNDKGQPYLPAEIVIAELQDSIGYEEHESRRRREQWEELPDETKEKFQDPEEQEKRFGDLMDWHFIGRAGDKVYSAHRILGSSEISLRVHVNGFDDDFNPTKKIKSREDYPSLNDAVAAAYQGMGFPMPKPNPSMAVAVSAFKVAQGSNLNLHETIPETTIPVAPGFTRIKGLGDIANYDDELFQEFTKSDPFLTRMCDNLDQDARTRQAIFNGEFLENSVAAREWNIFVARHKKAEAQKNAAAQDIDPTPG